MDKLWQITCWGSKTELCTIETDLENASDPPLSFSLFEDELPRWRLEIVTENKPDAHWLHPLQTHANIVVQSAKLPDKNWVLESLRFLTPIEAGRFYIHGDHDLASDKTGTLCVCIPAGTAFGTGHHETTYGCLLDFDDMLTAGETFNNVLDLGTGAGILALAAAKALPHAAILATDIDPEAIFVAKRNAATNAQETRIDWQIFDGIDPSSMKANGFDLIFANILAAPLIQMADEIIPLLQRKGRLILAGLLDEQTGQVEAAYTNAGGTLVGSRQLGDWRILVFTC